jgi:hypothetical protein
LIFNKNITFWWIGFINIGYIYVIIWIGYIYVGYMGLYIYIYIFYMCVIQILAPSEKIIWEAQDSSNVPGSLTDYKVEQTWKTTINTDRMWWRTYEKWSFKHSEVSERLEALAIYGMPVYVTYGATSFAFRPHKIPFETRGNLRSGRLSN